MRLRIVIPALNEEKYLPRLLRSIHNQKYPCEVIVADSESEDMTSMIAQLYGAKIVRAPKGLPSYARNIGARVAKGDVILFLDADVVLPKNFLIENVKEFENKRLDVAGCYFRPLSNRIFDWVAIEIVANAWMFAVQSFSPNAFGAALFTKRITFEKLRGFDETITFAEDINYTKIAFKKGWKFRMINKKALVSMRRFDKEGRFWLTLKYIKLNVQEFFGAIRTDENYKFGEF